MCLLYTVSVEEWGKSINHGEHGVHRDLFFLRVLSLHRATGTRVNSVVKSFLVREDEGRIHEGMFDDMDGEAVGVGDGFGGEDLARGADGCEMSADEQGNPVCVAGGEIEVVQGDEHGEVFCLCQLADQLQQTDLILQIQMCGGFIEQQNGRGLA